MCAAIQSKDEKTSILVRVARLFRSARELHQGGLR